MATFRGKADIPSTNLDVRYSQSAHSLAARGYLATRDGGHPRRRYDENGVGGFTSDLSTSMFDFFFSFFFTVLASFFAFFDPLSCLVIASPCTFYLCSPPPLDE